MPESTCSCAYVRMGRARRLLKRMADPECPEHGGDDPGADADLIRDIEKDRELL